MSVGRLCTREVHFAGPMETIRTAAQRMASARVGCLVVLDDHRRPIGMLTDRDIVVRVLAKAMDPATTRIHSVMTRDPATVTEVTSIEDALALMRYGGFRRLPVTGADGDLQGMVTIDDILVILAVELADIGRLVEGPLARSRSAST